MSWQLTCWVSKLGTHLHSPGTLHVPCSGLHPCLQMAFGKITVTKIALVPFPNLWQNHQLVNIFFSHVLQMVKSSKSHFRRFLVCEKREDLGRNNNGWEKKGHAWINGRCIQKWGDFKHSLNSSKNDTWHRRQTNFQRSSIKGSWEETTERITVSLLSSRTQCCSQWW